MISKKYLDVGLMLHLVKHRSKKKTQTVNQSLLTKSYAIKESMPPLQADNKRCHRRNKKGDEIITTISFYVVYVKALSQFHPCPDLFNLVVMRQINNI
jgi:hypothetical protein